MASRIAEIEALNIEEEANKEEVDEQEAKCKGSKSKKARRNREKKVVAAEAMDVEDAPSKVSVSSVSLDSTDSQQNKVLSPDDLAWVDPCLVKNSDIPETTWIPMNSTDSQQNEVLSPEDLAWVDSCLVKNSDIPETTWIPMKNALLEIIIAQPQSFCTDKEDIEILPTLTSLELNQESSTSDVEHSSEPYSTYVNPLSQAEESSTDELRDAEKDGSLPSLTFQGNPFLPTYNGDLMVNETKDLGLNLDSAYEVEHIPENIFRIWDLDIPSEEVELVKQLEKALSESQMVPSSVDDLGKLKKDLKENSLDDLVGSIADLSLN